MPYQLPPDAITRVLDTPPDPSVIWSPDTRWALLGSRNTLPDLADLARPMLPLAGMRIDPIAFSDFQIEFYNGLTLRNRSGDFSSIITLPDSKPGQSIGRIGFVSWSHKSDAFAFSRITEKHTELWMVRCEEPNRPILLTDRLHMVLMPIEWTPDGSGLLCGTVPIDLGEPPNSPLVPDGPNIQIADGRKSPARTYQDLLKDPTDVTLFEYYAKSRITIVKPGCPPEYLGEPDLFCSLTYSPNAQFLISLRLKPPYSYALPLDYFPKSLEIRKIDGSVVLDVADIPLQDEIPIGGVRCGPRSIQWWPGYPARLLWTEALDGGDPNRKVEHRDQIFFQDAPFDKPPTKLLKLQGRFTAVTYFRDRKCWLATEFDRDRRWLTSTLHRFISPEDSSETPKIESRIFFDRSIQDRYGDPGRVVIDSDDTGGTIAKQIQGQVVLAGYGASPEGNRPFVDLRDLETFETKRIWRCSKDESENVVAVLNKDRELTLLTRRESPTDPANFYLRNLETDQVTPLTHFVDPNPELRSIRKEIVKYQRSDGVPLSATLYLPANYKEGEKLPLVIWAYPLEFNDANTAGQVSGNPNSFFRLIGISHLALILAGYAVLDDAAMPVIGDPETMNDTFIPQIVDAAHSAIDHVVSLGIADPNRIAIGGHSYGAFMAANVLANSDRFRAGIARSGAYNRTLTPFGFQSERRPLWEAKSVYTEISPLLHADKIKTPLLLIHGEKDNNPGTFSMQSLRMFQAIQGNGGIAKLVMLPHEGHGYRSRQSVLHVQYEMLEWLDRWLAEGKSNQPT